MRILVVDDDPAVRRSVRKFLERTGHTVFEAGDGMRALDRVIVEEPEIMITDINMPNMDGLKLVKELCRFDHKLKIIAFSGSAPDELAALGAETSIHAVLPKPFSSQELYDAIRKVTE